MKKICIGIALCITYCLKIGALVVTPPSGHQPFFVIIAPTYKNTAIDPETGEPVCIGHVRSVVRQEYPYWHMICIDDCCPDGTGQLLQKFVKDNHLEDRVTVQINTERRGMVYNNWATIHTLPDDVIVVNVDGDDELIGTRALHCIAQAYADHNIWLTYGQFYYHPAYRMGGSSEIPAHVLQQNDYRHYTISIDGMLYYPWITSHVRTYKAWLFKAIKKDDLMFNDSFYPMAGDVATMIPMIEMASRGHTRFIPTVLYKFRVTGINELTLNSPLVSQCGHHVRARPKYQPLMAPFSSMDKS